MISSVLDNCEIWLVSGMAQSCKPMRHLIAGFMF